MIRQAVRCLACGAHVEGIPHAQLLEHGYHRTRPSRPVVERVPKRPDALLQRSGRVAEDSRLVPHDHAFDQIFHVVVDDCLDHAVAVREMVVNELARNIRLPRDGRNGRRPHPLPLEELARRGHNRTWRVDQTPRLHQVATPFPQATSCLQRSHPPVIVLGGHPLARPASPPQNVLHKS